MKITAEQIQEWEATQLIGALGNCLELNDLFLDRYASPEFANLLKQVPKCDREYVLNGITETHYFNGSPPGNNSQDIWLDVGEIEYQFEGDPSDVFENPDDFTINGDLAYLYVGYGLSITFDRAELLQSINDYLSEKS